MGGWGGRWPLKFLKNPIFGPFFDDYWLPIHPNTHWRVALWIEIAPLELPSDMQKDLIILLIRLVNQGTKVELVHGWIWPWTSSTFVEDWVTFVRFSPEDVLLSDLSSQSITGCAVRLPLASLTLTFSTSEWSKSKKPIFWWLLALNQPPYTQRDPQMMLIPLRGAAPSIP